MKFASFISIGALIALSSPTFATTVINAAAGEACKITEVGSFSCIWADADGGSTYAEGSVGATNYLSPYGLVGGFISVTNIPLLGWIEVELPYLAPNYQYSSWADHIRWGNITYTYTYRQYNEVVHRPIGNVHSQSTFSSLTCSEPDCTIYTNLRTRYLYSNTVYSGTPRFHHLSMHEGGTWNASLQWSFDEYAPEKLVMRSYFAVPEPSTWAMLIAGFGLVGIMRRRKHAIRQSNYPL